MAVFDRDNAKIVVRVVYDGPGNAGKTTNLGELCQFFTSRRRSELVSPEARDGRTMWFDWVQVDAGLVAGYGLRCQIVTVPGQVVLRRRRSALLRAADVVVLVCDSAPAGLELVRPAFGRIRQFITEQAGDDVPIVVQANKQDLPGALSPEEIGAALGADPSIPVVAARANTGAGVKETLVLAIRAAANRAQQLVLERGIDGLAGVPDDADAVLRELRRLDDAAGDALDDLLSRSAFVDDPAGEPPPLPPIPPPPGARSRPSAPPPIADIVAEPAAAMPPGPEPAVEPLAATSAAPSWWPPAPLGDATLAPGTLWPAATGRDVLRRLAATAPRPRLDLVMQHGERDGSGKPSAVIYDADGWCLKTSATRRFDDLDAARVALVKLARTKVALGALTLSGTVLVICADAAGSHWLWTLAPWRTTLRSALSDAVVARDPARIGAALVQFAGAVTEALVRARRTGQGLDLHPSNFASDGDALVYLDDEVGDAPPLLGAAHAILQRAQELAAYPAEVERYGASLIEQILGRLSRDDLARLSFLEDLRTTTPRTAPARALRARLLAALDARGATADVVLEPAPEPSPVPAAERLAEPEPAPLVPVAEHLLEPVPAGRPVLAGLEPVVVPPRDAWPLPPSAAEHLPSGFIWPVVAGRELVRQVLGRTPTRRDGLPFTYDLGDYTLSTSSERRFDEVDDGRAELLRLARAQVARGAVPPGLVLVLAPDEARGGHWIWTIAPAAAGVSAQP